MLPESPPTVQAMDDPPAVDELLDGDELDAADAEHRMPHEPQRRGIAGMAQDDDHRAGRDERPRASGAGSFAVLRLGSFSASFRSFSSLAAWLLPLQRRLAEVGPQLRADEVHELLHRLLERARGAAACRRRRSAGI